MPIYEYRCKNCGDRVEVLIRPSTLRQPFDPSTGLPSATLGTGRAGSAQDKAQDTAGSGHRPSAGSGHGPSTLRQAQDDAGSGHRPSTLLQAQDDAGSGHGSGSGAPSCPQCGSPLLEKLFSAPNVISRWGQPSGDGTCCGQEERCAAPPCSTGETCGRDH